MQDYSRLGVTTMKDRRKLFQASLFFFRIPLIHHYRYINKAGSLNIAGTRITSGTS